MIVHNGEPRYVSADVLLLLVAKGSDRYNTPCIINLTKQYMHKQKVMIDLKIARRKNRLLQSDLAHLLGTTQARVSRLEMGDGQLSSEELHKLCLIYDSQISSLFALTGQYLSKELQTTIKTMSGKISKDEQHAEVRQKMLHELYERLKAYNPTHYAD